MPFAALVDVFENFLQHGTAIASCYRLARYRFLQFGIALSLIVFSFES